MRVQLRHDSVALLEKLKDLPLEVQWKLAAPISLDCYKNIYDAFKGDGTKVSKFSMKPGRHACFYFAPIPEEK